MSQPDARREGVPTLAEIFFGHLANFWRRRRARRGRKTSPLRFETLENRLLLSADLIFNAPANLADDSYTLRLDSGNGDLELLNGTTVVASQALAETTRVIISGEDGWDDSLTVDFAHGGFFSLDGGITFNGGADGMDKLSVVGGEFTTVTHTATTTGPGRSGSMVYKDGVHPASVITYTDLEPIDMTGSTITDLVFNLPGTNDQGILEDDGTLANGVSQIRSQNATPTFETTTFSNTVTSLTVNMGGDDGSFTVASLPDFTGSLAINGQAGNDNVTFIGATNLSRAGADLSITVGGSITDAAGTNLQVSDLATLNAGLITLGDNAADTTNFGLLTFNAAGAVNITEDSAMVLTGNNVGSSATLVSGGTTTVNGTLRTTAAVDSGALDLISSGTVTLSGNIVTHGGAVTIFNSVILGSPSTVTIDTTDGGAVPAGRSIVITGTVNDDLVPTSLVLLAGTAGTVNLQGAVGGTTPIQGLTVQSGSTVRLPAVQTREGGVSVAPAPPGVLAPSIVLGGNISTNSGANAGSVSLNGAVRLGTDVTITTDHATGADGNVTFTAGSTISEDPNNPGPRSLAIFAGGGDVSFGGATGPLQGLHIGSANDVTLQSVTTRDGGLTVTTAAVGGDANSIALNGDIDTTLGTSSGNVSLVGPVTLANNTDINAGAGTGAISAPVSAAFSGASTIAAGTFSVGSLVVSGTGVTATLDAATTATTVTISGGGTANLNGATTIGNLSLAGAGLTGGLGGSGNVTLLAGGAHSWNSGLLSGSGVLTVASGATLTVGGGDHELNGKPIVNNGTVNWTAGRIDLGGGNFTFANQGVFELAANSQLGDVLAVPGTVPGSMVLTNTGLIRQQVAVITTFSNGMTVNNQGVSDVGVDRGVVISAGRVNFGGNGGTHTGDFNAVAGATLAFTDGTHAFDAGSSVTVALGGTLAVGGSGTQVDLDTEANLSGAIVVDGVSLANINPTAGSILPTTITVGGGSGALNLTPPPLNGVMAPTQVTISGGGTANLNGAATIGNLSLAGGGASGAVGGLGGSGDVTLLAGGTHTWGSGNLSGSGVFTVASGATLTVSGVDHFVNSKEIVNDGTVNWIAGGIDLNGDGSIFANHGVFELAASSTFGVITAPVGTMTLTNTGLIHQLTGTTTFGQGMTVNNDGLIEIAGGRVNFGGSGGTHAGDFDAAGGATLAFTGGTHAFETGSSVTVAGTLVVSNSSLSTPATVVALDTEANLSGAIVVSAVGGAGTLATLAPVSGSILPTTITVGGTFAVLNLTPPNAIAPTQVTISGGGTANLNGAATIGNLSLAGGGTSGLVGGLGGSGNVTLLAGGAHSWGSGNLEGSGLFTIASGATLTVTGGDHFVDSKTIVNDGTVNWIAGRIDLDGASTFANHGVFELAASSTIGVIFAPVGTMELTNTGLIRQQVAGTTTFGQGMTVNNAVTGLLDVQSGTVNVTGTLIQTGTIDVDSGATFQRIGGFNNTGVLSGNGTINAGAGNTLTNNGAIRPGSSPGLLTVNGNVSFVGTSSLDVEVNGSTPGTGHDQLNVAGTVTLNGAMLNATGTITPSPGQQIVLINNDGTDAILGIFSGRPQNSTVTINGVGFFLSYAGGDGNDVTLRANTAPVLVSSAATFPSIAEDTADPAGTSIAGFLAAVLVTDADDSLFSPGVAPRGIAVTGVDNSNGVWQFSLNGGVSWDDVGAVSSTSARLLDTSAQLRFLPGENFNGTATFVFRAWDQTTGASGGLANASTGGGTSAYSANVATATITVTPVNDAPVAVDDTNTTDEDHAVTGNVLANDTDADLDTLTVAAVNGQAANVGIAVTLASGALVTVNADGSYTYDPNDAFEFLNAGGSATDTFTYLASDGLLSDGATVTITVTGVNDASLSHVHYNASTDTLTFVSEGGAENNVTVTSPAVDRLRIVVGTGEAIFLSGDTSVGFLLSADSTQLDIDTSLAVISLFGIDLAGGDDTLSLTNDADNGLGSLTADGSEGSDSVTLNASSLGGSLSVTADSIVVDGTLSAATGVTLTGTGNTTILNDDIVTAGGAITINDSLILGDELTVTLDTTNGGAVDTGANITLAGTVDDDATLSGLELLGGTAGTVTLSGTVGGTLAPQSLTINAGDVAIQALVTTGTQSITAEDDVTVAAGSGPAALNATGSQAITAGGTLTVQGGAGSGLSARIVGSGGQTIDASSIAVTGGSVGSSSFAEILQTGAAGTQEIEASSITINGGTSGTNNFARIRNNGTGAQSIDVTGPLTLTGGTGGAPDLGNFAQIRAVGSQDIIAGNTKLAAGTSGFSNFAAIQSPDQDITIHGDLILMGGGSIAGPVNSGGARIGGLGGATPGPTNLTLTVEEDVTLTGGSETHTGAVIGSNFEGGQTTDITMLVGGSLTFKPGTVPNSAARIGSPNAGLAGGDISIEVGGDITLVGTVNPGFAGTVIRTLDSLTLQAGGTITMGGGAISSGTQTISAGGNITVAVAGANGASVTATGLQTITAGGALTVQGGAGTGLSAQILSSGGQMINASSILVAGGSVGNSSFAEIRQTGATAGQMIDASSITINGGTSGTDNFARIRNDGAGPLGAQTINVTGPLTLTGGTGGASDLGNFAQIRAVGTQIVDAGNTALFAGGAGFSNFAGINSPDQDITIHGTLTLTGGSSVAGPTSGGGARIGGLGGTITSPTNLDLKVEGSVTMNGGTEAHAGAVIGSSFTGETTDITNITMLVGGSLTMNPGTVPNSGARIGSPSTNPTGGDISITAGGNITMGGSLTVGALGTVIRTIGGKVTLDADGAITVAGSVLSGAQTVRAGGNLTVTATGATSAVLSASGAQTIDVGGTLTVRGGSAGSDRFAMILGIGEQTIDAAQITLQGGSGGTNNFALITGSTQVISSVGNVELRGGAGNGNSARIGGLGGGGAPDQPTNLTLEAGGDVLLQAGNVTGTGAQIGPTGTGAPQPTAITITAGQNVILNAGTAAAARIGSANAGTALGDISIAAGASIQLNGTTQAAVIRTLGSVDLDAGTSIFIGGSVLSGAQSVSAGGNITVAVAGANGASVTATGLQTITAGGALTVQGGAGTGLSAQILSSGGQMINASSILVAGGSVGNSSFAEIRQTGATAGQMIDASSITINGGTSGTDNFARIRNDGAGPLGAQTINVTGPLTLTGGTGGASDLGNFAQIRAVGTQIVDAGNTALFAGGAGFSNFAGINSPDQDITIHGTLTLTGGSSVAGPTSGGGARIGGLGGTITSPTNLDLKVEGSVTMNGGTEAHAGAVIGSSFTGETTDITNITMLVGGSLTMNPGTVPNSGARIGSPSTNPTGGDISITAGGNITMGGSLTVGALGTVIRTIGGKVTLDADGAITVAGSVLSGAQTVRAGGNLTVTATGATSAVLSASGAQTIDVGGTLTVRGGSAGSDRFAMILGIGEQTIDAAQITLQGGSGGTNNFALITGSTQVISSVGNVELRGGAGNGNSARIGGLGGGGAPDQPTNLTLEAGGDVLLQAGNVTGTGAQIGPTGTGAPQPTAITITAGQNVILNAGTAAAARIGSANAGTALGDISIAAGASIQLNGTTQAAVIRTLGNVGLHAGSTISEIANGFIVANNLATTSNGDTILTGPNQVAAFNASSVSGNISFNNTSTLLTVTGISQASSAALALSQVGNLAFTGSAVSGSQTISVTNADRVTLDSPGGGVASLIALNGTQTLSITGTGANALVLGSPGSLGISQIAGAFQTIIAGSTGEAGSITIFGSAASIGGANSFIVSGQVAGGTQTVSTPGALTVIGGNAPTGAVAGILANGTNGTNSKQTINAGSIFLQGGNGGNGNGAQIAANSGSQLVIVTGGGISLIGGTGGTNNQAAIREGFSTSLSAGESQTVTVIGGGINLQGGSGTGNGVFISGTVQDISATGSVTLSSSVSSGNSAASIGSVSTKPTNLELRAGGDVVLTGGAANSAAFIGSAGTIPGPTNDIKIVAGGSVILNVGVGSGARIGSSTAAAAAAGNISITAGSVTPGGDIVLNSNATQVARIRTLGNVELHADSLGGTISEGPNALIEANALTTTSHSGTNLVGPNQVAVFNATNTTSGNVSLVDGGGLTVTGISNPVGEISVSTIGQMTVTGSLDSGTHDMSLTAPGGVLFTDSAVVNVDLGGTAANVFTNITISNAVTLDGTLDVEIDPLFVPTAGDRFRFMTFASQSGSFDVTNLPASFTLESNPGFLELVFGAANAAPVFVEIADQTVEEGHELSFTVSATDPDDPANELVYSATGLPAGATFDPVTREFSWIPADDAVVTVTFLVTDPDGATDTMDVVLTATNVAPTVDAGANQMVGLQKVKNEHHDHDDDDDDDDDHDHGHGHGHGHDREATVDITAVFNDLGTLDTHANLNTTINWGDGTVDVGTVSESPFGPPGSTAGADGTVTGTHTYTAAGVYTVTVTVTDDNGGVHSDTLQVTVKKPTENKHFKARGDEYKLNEDSVLQVDAENGVLDNDRGPAGATLQARLVEGPDHGELVFNADGSFIYTPDADFNGKDWFWYEFTDGVNVSEAVKVQLKIKAVYDAPVSCIDWHAHAGDGWGAGYSPFGSQMGSGQSNFSDFGLELFK